MLSYLLLIVLSFLFGLIRYRSAAEWMPRQVRMHIASSIIATCLAVAAYGYITNERSLETLVLTAFAMSVGFLGALAWRHIGWAMSYRYNEHS